MSRQRALCTSYVLLLVCVSLAAVSSSASATQIAGVITTSGGQAVSGVSVTASNAGGSTTSAADGTYSLTVPLGWSGVVSVVMTGYVFTPGARRYVSVTTDKVAEDYTASAVPAGGFFEAVASSLPAIGYSATPWGDYDGDGRMDVLMAGDAGTSAMIVPVAKLMHNATGGFSEVTSGLFPVTMASAAWSDYDGDGKIDLAVSGWNSSDSCKIYRNGGGGSFTDIGAGLPGNMDASIAWVDYDNDGRPDLSVNGWDGFALYRNDGGVFTDASPGGVSRAMDGATVWADYDNDGDMDVLVAGTSNHDQYGNEVPVTKLYRNEGGTFVDTGISFPQFLHCSAAWGDYDADGNLDLAICGSMSWGYRYTYIYHNDGQGNLTDIATPLVGVDHAQVAWSDYDNDGDLDLAVCGYTGTGIVTKIYRNDAGTFVDSGETLDGVMDGSLTWADYDGDGRPDLLVTGSTTNNVDNPMRIIRLYHNRGPVANTPPTTPTGFGARIIGKDLVLNWTASTDAEGMAGGLSYNIRMGTAADKQEIVPSCSDIATGQRLIPAIGNAQKKLSWTVKDLPTGVPYYCSVQSIDSGLMGSGWAAGRTVSLVTISGTIRRADGKPSYGVDVTANNGGGSATTDKNGYYEVIVVSGWSGRITPRKTDYTFTPAYRSYTNVTTNQTNQDFTSAPPRWEGLTVGAGLFGGSVAWGDFDNDGRLDLAGTGGISSAWGIDNPVDPRLKIFHNTDGSGDFVEAADYSPGYAHSSLALGDINGDGNVDLAVQGNRGTGGFPATYVYSNVGGSFNIGVGLPPGMAMGSLSWGDYNNDGAPDLLATGLRYNGQVFVGYADIFRNDKTSGSFISTSPGIAGVGDGAGSAWGDFDNDGDLDLAVSGNRTSYGRYAAIYRDDGGVFTDIGAPLLGVGNSSLAWVDYNNDGRLDLAIVGQAQIGASLTFLMKIYRNDGNGVFTDINAPITVPVAVVMAWGDYDNDGRPDVAIAGSSDYTTTAVPVFKLYHNDGGDAFSEVTTSVKPVHRPAIAWGDFDNDGALDLAVSGIEEDGTIVTKVYRNNLYLDGISANTPPTAPTALTAVRNGVDVTFSWQAASDTQTPVNGLTYNLRVGTTPGGNEIMAGNSDTNGWRKIPDMGNVQKRLSWTLKNLSAGVTYYWSAQAVDTSYAGSPWAPEQVIAPISNMTVSQAKLLADGSQVRVDQTIVSRAFPDFFYIESDDRYSGIRVERLNHGLSVGNRADVTGTVRTNADGERYIEADQPTADGVGWMQPLVMPIRSIGGGDWSHTPSGTEGQAGVTGSTGLNNVGLLVTAVGYVTYSTTGYFYVDDGSGARDNSGYPGIKVLTNGFTSPDVDTYQRVTGISSCYKTNGIIYPVIRVSSAGDVIEIPTW